jgi:hypothetical protein
LPVTAEGPDTVGAGLAGDALQVDHHARLATSIPGVVAGPDHTEVARPGRGWLESSEEEHNAI